MAQSDFVGLELPSILLLRLPGSTPLLLLAGGTILLLLAVGLLAVGLLDLTTVTGGAWATVNATGAGSHAAIIMANLAGRGAAVRRWAGRRSGWADRLGNIPAAAAITTTVMATLHTGTAATTVVTAEQTPTTTTAAAMMTAEEAATTAASTNTATMVTTTIHATTAMRGFCLLAAGAEHCHAY